MGSRLYYVLVIFCFAATLILTVYLQGSRNRVFYTLQRYRVEQGRLQQELWQKQLRVEGLINPASISLRLDQQGAGGGAEHTAPRQGVRPDPRF